MPSLRDSFKTMRGRAGDGTIEAHARLKSAKIVEEYTVCQDISRNPWIEQYPRLKKNGLPDEEYKPSGLIELAIPYDGERYFTRRAAYEVERALATRAGTDAARAVIGYLKLSDYGQTNLDTRLELPDPESWVPIEIPVADAGGVERLSADQQTRAARYEYEPEPPETIPAELKIDLFDPDSLDMPEVYFMAENDRARIDMGKVMDRMRQQVGFRNELILSVRVRLFAPWSGLHPRVRRVTVGWPTITSLHTLELRALKRADGQRADTGDGLTPPLYNPYEKQLEWGEDIAMSSPEDGEQSRGTAVYESPVMLLSIKLPGELYEGRSLRVGAEIEIPGFLLSGLRARLHDVDRSPYDSGLPETLTRVTVAAELVLDDAFEKRYFTPYQQLFFDEIIPDDMRVTDILTALRDRGFTAARRRSMPDSMEWFLEAERQEGPEKMILWILVEGQRYKAERETTMPGGGVILKTELESGELRISMLGLLRRDPKAVTREMNELHQLLRERYQRVRQRR